MSCAPTGGPHVASVVARFYKPCHTKGSGEDAGAVTLFVLGERRAPRFQQLIQEFEEWRATWAS